MRLAIRDLIRQRTDDELFREYMGRERRKTPRENPRCPDCDNELNDDGFCLGSRCREVKR
jgi:transposase